MTNGKVNVFVKLATFVLYSRVDNYGSRMKAEYPLRYVFEMFYLYKSLAQDVSLSLRNSFFLFLFHRKGFPYTKVALARINWNVVTRVTLFRDNERVTE